MFFALKYLIGIVVVGAAIFAGVSYLLFFVEVEVSSPTDPIRIDQQQLDAAADRAGDRAAQRMRAQAERDREASELRHRQHNKAFNEGIPGWEDY